MKGLSCSSSTRCNYENAYLILLSILKAYVLRFVTGGVFVGDYINYPFSSFNIKFCIFLPESLPVLEGEIVLLLSTD